MRETARVKSASNIIQFTYVDDLTNGWKGKVTFGVKIKSFLFTLLKTVLYADNHVII